MRRGTAWLCRSPPPARRHLARRTINFMIIQYLMINPVFCFGGDPLENTFGQQSKFYDYSIWQRIWNVAVCIMCETSRSTAEVHISEYPILSLNSIFNLFNYSVFSKFLLNKPKLVLDIRVVSKEINTFSSYFIFLFQLTKCLWYISFSDLSAKQFNMLHFILIRLHRKYVKRREKRLKTLLT